MNWDEKLPAIEVFVAFVFTCPVTCPIHKRNNSNLLGLLS